MSVFVIVDDDDSNVQYSPITGSGNEGQIISNSSIQQNGWFVGGLGRDFEFRATTSASGFNSSTMNYTFNGSSIWVFGSAIEDWATTNMSFSIDGDIIDVYSAPSPTVSRYHAQFFSYVSSSFTMHTLGVEISGTEASNATLSNLFIDYIIYEATPNSSIPTADGSTSWVLIDDTSPYLNISSDWSRNGPLPNFTPPASGGNLTDAVLNSTVLAPTASGASISLTFTGVSHIEAYGMLLENVYSLGTWYIDGENSSPLGVTSLPTQYPHYSYKLLTAQVDPDSSHTLTITASGENAFFLDYFLLQTDSAFVTSEFTVVNSGAPSPTSTSIPTTTPGPSRHANIGGIVGGVIGGLAGLAVVVMVVFFCVRKRRTIHSVGHGAGQMYTGPDDADRDAMQEQDQRPGPPAGLSHTSDNITSPRPFLQMSPGDNSGHVASQFRKAGTHAGTAIPAAIFTGTNMSGEISSPGMLVGPLARLSRTALILESDSGLRGPELTEILPPGYTLE